MTISTETIPVVDAIAPLGKSYAAWLVDIWGVMHNGVRAFPSAVEATRRFREQGGIVILLSNSPRPSEPLQQQLTQPRRLRAELRRHGLLRRLDPP